MTREQAERWLRERCPGGVGHAVAVGLTLYKWQCRACLLDALAASPAQEEARLREECAKFHTPGCMSVERLIFSGNCCQVNDAILAAASGNLRAVQAVIGPPAQGEAGRCKGERLRGGQCPNPAADGSPFCWSHGGGPAEPAPADQCPSPAPEPRPEVLTFGVQGRDTPEVRELVGAAASMLRRRCEKPDEVCAPFVGDGPCTLCGDWEDEQRAIRRGHSAPPSETVCPRCGETPAAAAARWAKIVADPTFDPEGSPTPCDHAPLAAPPSEKEETAIITECCGAKVVICRNRASLCPTCNRVNPKCLFGRPRTPGGGEEG